MAHKVLTLFWNLAHAEDVTTEIMDQALAAHVKILDYSCSQVTNFANLLPIFIRIGRNHLFFIFDVFVSESSYFGIHLFISLLLYFKLAMFTYIVTFQDMVKSPLYFY